MGDAEIMNVLQAAYSSLISELSSEFSSLEFANWEVTEASSYDGTESQTTGKTGTVIVYPPELLNAIASQITPAEVAWRIPVKIISRISAGAPNVLMAVDAQCAVIRAAASVAQSVCSMNVTIERSSEPIRDRDFVSSVNVIFQGRIQV